MEGVPHNQKLFTDAIKYYTNRGALKACIGRQRHFTLTEKQPFKNFFIDKFVPRAVRRIVPYSYFGILVHVPFAGNTDQYYYDTTPTATTVANVGVQAAVSYDEWNIDHIQEMTTT